MLTATKTINIYGLAVKILVKGYQSRTLKERSYNVNNRIGVPCGVGD